MAKVLLSSIASSLSGSLSNFYFMMTRAGACARTRPRPHRALTTVQRLHIDAFSRLQTLYSSLSDLVKAAQALFLPSLYPEAGNWHLAANMYLETVSDPTVITPPNNLYPTFWTCYVKAEESNYIRLWAQSNNEASDQYMYGYSRRWLGTSFEPLWVLSTTGARLISYHNYDIKFLHPATPHLVCLFPYDLTIGAVGQSFSFAASTS